MRLFLRRANISKGLFHWLRQSEAGWLFVFRGWQGCMVQLINAGWPIRFYHNYRSCYITCQVTICSSCFVRWYYYCGEMRAWASACVAPCLLTRREMDVRQLLAKKCLYSAIVLIYVRIYVLYVLSTCTLELDCLYSFVHLN